MKTSGKRNQELEVSILNLLKNRFNKVERLTPYEGEVLKKNLLYVEPLDISNQVQIYSTPLFKRVAMLYGTDMAFSF